VARAWNLDVRPQAGIRRLGALGLYHPTEKRISLAVENVSVWAHEMVHAAEDRLGQLDGAPTEERHVEREVVAQLGAAILLEELGLSKDADLGGSYAYLERQCKTPAAVLGTCDRLLKRTLAAVTLLLDTADEIAGRSSAA
jgi:antirestriction protein ArdC